MKQSFDATLGAGSENKVSAEEDIETLNGIAGAVDPSVAPNLKLALVQAGAEATDALADVGAQNPRRRSD